MARLPAWLRDFGRLLWAAWQRWSADKAPAMAAALAYYTVFSLAPMLVIVIACMGLVFGREQVRLQLIAQIASLIGDNGAQAVDAMIKATDQPQAGVMATAVGLAVLLIGATGVFTQLQDSLNTVWEVRPRPGRGLVTMLRDRFLSFAMILGVGFILLVSLVLSAGVAAVGSWLDRMFPGAQVLLQALNFGVGFAVTATLFLLIYKLLPDVKLRWRDAVPGALGAALLFSIGRFLIGLYLGKSSVSSAYGAAGSLVVILIWVYYSAQILIFGAEFTRVLSDARGQRVEPTASAERITRTERMAKAEQIAKVEQAAQDRQRS